MRLRWALAVTFLLSFAGCSLFDLPGSFCPNHAVGIKVKFSGEAQLADEVAFRVWIDEGTQWVTMGYKRSPGGDPGTLEVDFKDYDAKKFHTVHVVAIAREKGKRIGAYKEDENIGNDCTSVEISFYGSGGGYDYCASNADCTSGECTASGCCSTSSSSFCL
jgi:hypothetical protein